MLPLLLNLTAFILHGRTIVSSKKILIVLATALALTSSNAHAWFFFFIPGSVTGKIGDALTGAEGDQCVKETAKVGDVLRSPSGNTAVIKSLSGTSTRCQNNDLPIRARLEFTYNFSSEAGLDIPDGYEQKPLNDFQRFNGFLLKAENSIKRTGIMVNSRRTDSKTDPTAVMHAISESMSRMITDTTTANEEELNINGMKALRFEMTGKNKGAFGLTYTYVVTMLVGKEELLVVNAWAPVDDYPSEKDALKQLAWSVKGIADPAGAARSNELQTKPVAARAVAVAAPTQGAQAGNTEETVKKLREIDKLYKEGVLNQQEYEGKKKELLKGL
jgi:hypothetical protein